MFIKLYFIALPLFLVIDVLWLGFIAKNFYAKHIGFIMTNQINWIAAIIFYLLFIAGLVLFVIQPALLQETVTHALVLGAFFGLVTYATYDLTNLATLKDWPLVVTIVDLIWGAFIGGSVSALTYVVATKWL